MCNSSTVAVAQCEPTYPPAPYSPDQRYPEYSFSDVLAQSNGVYDCVRQMLFSLGMDRANFGTRLWNPLRDLLSPGDRVVVKPNLVRDFHPAGCDMSSVVTHASVLRPLIDYILMALKGVGQVCICDAPLFDTDFEKAVDVSGIGQLVLYYRQHGMDVSVVDLREERVVLGPRDTILSRAALQGDPRGYREVDLGIHSEFDALSPGQTERLFATAYDRERLGEAHRPGSHKYSFAGTILEADAVFFVPKMKTHHKAGVTLSLKNVVGVMPRKQWIPHHRIGSPDEGGDEYPADTIFRKAEAGPLSTIVRCMGKLSPSGQRRMLDGMHVLRVLAERMVKQLLPGFWSRHGEEYELARVGWGAWQGNDTIWRTVLDLNRILLYARKDGGLADSIQRRYFCLIDGIIGGEAQGPLSPRPREAGLLVAGLSPVAVDVVASTLMGIDYAKIRHIAGCFQPHHFPLVSFAREAISVVMGENVLGVEDLLSKEPLVRFEPPLFWRGHVEL